MLKTLNPDTGRYEYDAVRHSSAPVQSQQTPKAVVALEERVIALEATLASVANAKTIKDIKTLLVA